MRSVPVPWVESMGRKPLVVLVALLEACAGSMAIGPGGTPASNCEWHVCVYEAARDGNLEVWARNDEPIVATVTLSFDLIENAQLTEDQPIVRTVPSGRNVLVAKLRRVHPTGSIAAHPKVAIDLGSDATQPDADVLYSAPFGGSEPRQIIGGYGSPTHLEANFYALDFAMPEGTPVLAARSGIVVEVQDGFTKGGLRPELIQRANLVAVAHSDGTLASYGHLRAGIEVAEGDTVSTGQLLGYSGSTGFSGQPHLHFHVGKRLMGGEDRTIPIRLRGRDGTALEPSEGEWYEPAVGSVPRGGSRREGRRPG